MRQLLDMGSCNYYRFEILSINELGLLIAVKR